MRQDARMLAALLGRSMGLGEAWEVSGTWSGEVEGGPDELHVRVARRRGHAIPCPVCGVPCGVHDTRERTWRHLGVWQFRTYVHCAVPRTDCPGHGAGTVPVPWEVRPNSHFTALFEAQVLAACMRGSTVKAVAEALGEDDHRLWDMLGRAVAQARGSADYSDVRRVGTGETSRSKGHTYISTMPGLDGRRCVAVTDGGDWAPRPARAAGPEAHGGDGAATAEAARDVSGPLSCGVPGEMPQAARAAGRSRATRPLPGATDRAGCRERRESDERREAPGRAKRVWLKREESPAGRRREVRERLAPDRSHPGTARACQTAETMRDACGWATAGEARPMLDRLPGWTARPDVPDVRGVARTVRERREGILGYLGGRPADAYLEGANSLIQSIKKAARGFRNVEYLATAILPGLGGLSFDALACAQS